MEISSTRLKVTDYQANDVQIFQSHQDAIRSLSPTELQIYQASLGTMIKEMGEEDKIKIASKVWSFVKIKLGLRTENASEEKVQILSLADDLSQFKGLTQEDVMNAVRRGIGGEYLGKASQVFFNSSNFIMWIKCYREEREEVRSKVLLARVEDPTKPKPNDQELKATAIKLANDYADSLEAHGLDFKWYDPGLSKCYEFIRYFKIWAPNDEIRMEITGKFIKIIDPIELDRLCKAEAYKKFIQELVDFGVRVDPDGNINPVER